MPECKRRTTSKGIGSGCTSLARAATVVGFGVGSIAAYAASPRSPADIACYPSNLTPGQAASLARTGGLPPSQFVPGGGDRFILDPLAWNGDVQIGPSGQAARARLTYSFAKDTTVWGLFTVGQVGPSDLNSRLIALFGSGNLDLGREYIRQGIASWKRFTGVSYSEVADDSSPMDDDPARSPLRGDIRIGGKLTGIDFFLAYNAFPSGDAGAFAGGGDMYINSSFFLAQYFNDPANEYRYFRNTVAHEHGHALGLVHTTPCNGSKLMEPFIAVGFDMVQTDDIRAAQRNYGDRYSGNSSALSAVVVGDLASPTPRSFAAPWLSVNGAGGPGGSGEDWFRFDLSTPQPVTITATPQGGTYQQGSQVIQCDAANVQTVAAQQAGNLVLELRSADGGSILLASTGAAAGFPESITASLQSGSYCVRIADTGPNPSSAQVLQLYDLSIRTAWQPLPPAAIAGLNKRIWSGSKCFFNGSINSWTNEPGATINSYAWDLDGDGSFETAGSQVFRTYPSNGVLPVTLRVTDSNGRTGTDTIHVSVFNATASITGVSPSQVSQGAFRPVTITGTNFKGVTSAAQFSVSGSGVSFVGTPVVNALGTQVSGLAMVVTPTAPTGVRSISVTNSDGLGGASGNAVSAPFITVSPPSSPPVVFSLRSPPDGAVGTGVQPQFLWDASDGAFSYTLRISDDPLLAHVVFESPGIGGNSLSVPPGSLQGGRTYWWGVRALNPVGTLDSTPYAASFTTSAPPICQGDVNSDGLRNTVDLVELLLHFGSHPPVGDSADINADGAVDTLDLTLLLNVFGDPC